MKIPYKKLEIFLKLDYPIIIKKPLIFNFRSIIGKELKKISCLFKRKKKCEECLINTTCPYSFYFESPEFERGNKKPHPFTLYINFSPNKEIDEIIIELTLIGEKAISYFPYFYFSIVKSGEKGIFKEKIKFKPIDVKTDEKSILISEDNLNMDFFPDIWKLKNNLSDNELKEISIFFLTPVRIKKQGKITSKIDYNLFLASCFRRVKFLSQFYGKSNPDIKIDFSKIPEVLEEDNNFEKISLNYYSSRQKRKIVLIGFKGCINVKKEFTPFELSLLKASKIFNLGSNTTFGFGKIDYK